MQRGFGFAAFGIVAAIVWATFPALATVFPPEGGKGDRGEEVRCPGGHILVGFTGRTGLWIDQISLMCARLDIPGFTTHDVVVLAPPRGGIGGSGEEKYCEANAGIRDINITFERITDGGLARRAYVAGVDFSCTRPADGSFKGRRRFGPGSKWPPASQACPGSEYATGLTIRYGGHVNAVGLICSAIANWPPTSRPATSGTPPAPQSIGAGMEDNTDRPGWDYKRLAMGKLAGPAFCQYQCKAEGDRCRAWTYVRPGVQGPSGVCYLKTAEPDAKSNTCCISGLNKKIVGLDTGGALAEGMENNTDRAGSDIHRFELQDANPGICQARCTKLERCKAWTYVRPGVQGPKAVCYLKNAAPQAASNKCCISGVKTVASDPSPTEAADSYSPPSAPRCKPGFGWRQARRTDYVCVTPESQTMVTQENAVAASRWNPDGAYGPNTCIAGFVWREAFDGDTVCVTPERRSAVKEENRLGPSRTE